MLPNAFRSRSDLSLLELPRGEDVGVVPGVALPDPVREPPEEKGDGAFLGAICLATEGKGGALGRANQMLASSDKFERDKTVSISMDMILETLMLLCVRTRCKRALYARFACACSFHRRSNRSVQSGIS